jgi:hypothetical protein
MTKLYFHAASSTDTGTLPSSVQSALGTPADIADAASVNRSMDTNIGSSQATLSVSVPTHSSTVVYITRFCSPPMDITSLASDTWNYTFATGLSSGTQSSAKWPCSGSNQKINITLYVWRPSNGIKIATVLDGSSNATFTATNSTSEFSYSGTFAGSSVSFAVGDILCFEVILSLGTVVTATDEYFYDGTIETNNNGTQASHIDSPNNMITFQGAATVSVFPRFFDTRTPSGGVALFLGNQPPMLYG